MFNINNAASTAIALQATTSGTGGAGAFTINNPAASGDALTATTNGGATSWALRATSTGSQGAGIFNYNNPAGSANAVRILNNGSGISLFTSTSGTGHAGRFENTYAANPVSTVEIQTNSTNARGLSVRGPDIWGSAIGITNTSSNMEWRMNVQGTTWQVSKLTGATFTPFRLFQNGNVDFPNTTGTVRVTLLDNGNMGIGTATPTNPLHVAGKVRIVDGTEGLNKIFTSNATGVGSWQSLAAIGAVSGTGTLNYVAKWTPDGFTIGNSIIYDNAATTTIGGVGVFTANNTTTFRSTAASSNDASLGFVTASEGAGLYLEGATGDLHITQNNNSAAAGTPVITVEDATLNVGIGTVTPTYRLDVAHNGGTGIRSRSTSSFSVVDIDAFNGDAALRFQSNGTYLWNIRNRPHDNYLEIFEMDGGRISRMVIQDGTGRVGVSTNNPTARMHITGDAEATFVNPNLYVSGPAILGVKVNTNVYDNTGVIGFANNGNGQNVGVAGIAGNTGSGFNVGGVFVSEVATTD